MTKRICIAIAFVAVNLAACCCGAPGVVNNAVPVPPVAQVNPPAKPPVKLPQVKPIEPKTVEVKMPVDPLAGFVPEPAPVFVPFKNERPAQTFKPILSSTVASPSDKIKVELLSAEIAGLQLAIKLRVHNEGNFAIDYKPWHAGAGKDAIPSASDERGKQFAPQGPAEGAQPGPLKLEPGMSIVDAIAFSPPNLVSQEVDFKLPGRNISLPSNSAFTFKMGRDFFAQKADARLQKLNEDAHAAAFKLAHEKWELRVVAAKQKLVSDEISRIARAKQDAADRVIREARAAEAAEAQAEEARLQRIEDAKPKVRRVNYNKLVDGISLAEAQEILGPAKENVRSGSLQVVSWSSKGRPFVVISATFDGGYLKAKSIID